MSQTRLLSPQIDLAITVFSIALAYITAGIITYYLHEYYKHRRDATLQKRHYPLVISINILSLILLTIQMPIIQLSDISTSIIGNHLDQMPIFIYDLFLGYIVIFVFYGIIYLMVIRLWLIHYSIKWAVASKTIDVLKYINDESPQNNWYIINKQKYGRFKTVLKLFSIPYLLSCFIMCIVYGVTGGYYVEFEIINPIILLTPIIVAAIIWNKTPVFNDFFRILTEMRFAIIGGFLGGLIYEFSNIIYALLSTYYHVDALIFHRLAYFVMIILLGHTNLFMTFWVLHHSGLIDTKKTNKHNKCCRFRSNALSHVELLIDTRKSIDLNLFAKVTLVDVLSDRNGFDLFVMHILKEFSTENILAVIEFTQFRDFYDDHLWDLIDEYDGYGYNEPNARNTISLNISILDSISTTVHKPRRSTNNTHFKAPIIPIPKRKRTKKIKLPAHVPKSMVVYDECLGMIDKVKALVEKYIVIGSKFELNISGGLRELTVSKYQQMIFGELDEEDGLYIFDDVKNCIMKLMSDSFTRFQTTEEYNTFLHKYTANKIFDL
eukprot:21971_1